MRTKAILIFKLISSAIWTKILILAPVSLLVIAANPIISGLEKYAYMNQLLMYLTSVKNPIKLIPARKLDNFLARTQSPTNCGVLFLIKSNSMLTI